MNDINDKRFELLLKCVHRHPTGEYELFDNTGCSVRAVYDTDYESDNGLDEDDEDYEEYQCIAFERKADGVLFEVNHYQIPVKAICNGQVVY